MGAGVGAAALSSGGVVAAVAVEVSLEEADGVVVGAAAGSVGNWRAREGAGAGAGVGFVDAEGEGKTRVEGRGLGWGVEKEA